VTLVLPQETPIGHRLLVPVTGEMYSCCTTGLQTLASELARVRYYIISLIYLSMTDQKSKKKGWISFRVTPEEYDKIHSHFNTSTCHKLSEYARSVLLQQPVTIKYRNQSSDDFLADMLKLKKDLNGVANNFNQAVHKLHTLERIAEFRSWIMIYENSRQSVEKKIEEIKLRMDQIYKQWLQ
jgi:hypothetical protein